MLTRDERKVRFGCGVLCILIVSPGMAFAALSWTDVRHACTALNVGEVTAKLDGIPWGQSWEDTCAGKIAGQRPPNLDKFGATGQPHRCEKDALSTGIWGKWTVNDDAACAPDLRWEGWKKAGCFGPNKQVYSARLVNSSDWEADCKKTDTSGVAGKTDWGTPDRCVKDALATGIWGEWYTDEQCQVPLAWGNFTDNGCVKDMDHPDVNAGGVLFEGKRSYSSVLWNVGGEWTEACKFASASVVLGEDKTPIAEFEHPTGCVVADADRAMGYVVGAILGAAGGLAASPASPKVAVAVGAVVAIASTAATEALLAGVNTNLNVWGIFWVDDTSCGTVPSYAPVDGSTELRLPTGQLVQADPNAAVVTAAAAGGTSSSAAYPSSAPIAQCPETAQSLRGSGQSVTCSCTQAQAGNGNVWGTGPYTDDSSVCRAAVHAGVIPASGGPIQFEIVGGHSAYAGSTSNGVTTISYGAWPGAVVVRKP